MGYNHYPFTQEIADIICAALAAGRSLRDACSEPGMPSEATVRAWAVDDVEGFNAQYTRARQLGLDCMADELLHIARTPLEGRKTKTKSSKIKAGDVETDAVETETEVSTGDAVDRSKLYADKLQWYLSKLAPKRYGDKIEIEHSGSVSIEDRLRAGRKRVGGA